MAWLTMGGGGGGGGRGGKFFHKPQNYVYTFIYMRYDLFILEWY